MRSSPQHTHFMRIRPRPQQQLLNTPPPLPQATCPQRVVFVLKEGEQWTNSGGGDFVAHLKPPGAEGGLAGGGGAGPGQPLCSLRPACGAEGWVGRVAGLAGAMAQYRSASLACPAEVMEKILVAEAEYDHW